MKSVLRLRDIIVLGAVALAACAPQPASTLEAMMDMETPTADAMMGHETPTADAMLNSETPTKFGISPEAAMPAAEWLGTR
jgi:hypothetical protein